MIIVDRKIGVSVRTSMVFKHECGLYIVKVHNRNRIKYDLDLMFLSNAITFQEVG